MNRLIIIGNGFDLAHGLNTKYSQFIDDLLYNEIQKYFDFENGLKRHEALIHLHSNKVSERTIKESIPKGSVLSQLENLGGDYNLRATFPVNKLLESIFNNSNSEKWVDLEQDFFNQLENDTNHIIRTYDNKDSSEGKLRARNKQHNASEQLNKQLEVLKEKLINYLINENKRTSDFTTDAALLLQMNEVSNPLWYEHLPTFPKNSDSKNLIILNFNYTNTIELYLPVLQIMYEGSVHNIHIHGELENKHNPVILGFGDEGNETLDFCKKNGLKEALKNIKSYNYHNTRNYQNLLRLLKDPYEALVMGHGCGNSDGTLLKTIFNNDMCKLIRIYHNGKDDYYDKIYNLSNHLSDSEIFKAKILNFMDSEHLAQPKDKYEIEEFGRLNELEAERIEKKHELK